MILGSLAFPLFQSGWHSTGWHLGRSIMGKILGLGCQGKWCLLDRDMECHHFTCPWAGIAKYGVFLPWQFLAMWSLLGHGLVRTCWVGLHSYGFMDKAFVPLMAFIGSQVALIALAYLPAFFSLLFNKREQTA